MLNPRSPKAQAGIGSSRCASVWRSVSPRVIPRSVAVQSSCWVARLVRAITPRRAATTPARDLSRLLPDLAGPGHHILGRRHFRQTHRAASVQLLRGDSDLGPEPELTSVDKPP